MTTATTDATTALVEHIGDLDLEVLPPAVLTQAKVVLADTVAILLAASLGESVRAASTARPLIGDGAATVVGHAITTTPDHAAFVNAIGGHDIELDDSHSPSRTHAASVLVPAALAAAEAAGGATGAAILLGIVAGYDVQVRLSRAIGVQRQFDHGFHPTSVCGTIGAAVTSGKILGLSPEQLRTCIMLASSQSSGLMTWQDDVTHMVKSFQTGIAARNGLYASLLARNSFGGAGDVLTGRHSMLVAFGGQSPEPDQLTAALRERWDICETSIKRYPCGGQTHAAVAALLDIRESCQLGWAEIERIDVDLAQGAISIIDNSPLLIANVQYVLALAAHEGSIERRFFTDPRWTEDPRIAMTSAKVVVRSNADIDRTFPAKKGAIVTVTTARGTFRRDLDAPPGSPWHPLSPAELKGKFTELACDVLTEAAARRLWELLDGFESVPDTREFFEIIAAQGGNRRPDISLDAG
jgi:2-methylcitrate dehydratase PrpD